MADAENNRSSQLNFFARLLTPKVKEEDVLKGSSAYSTASWLSVCFYFWASPLLYFGSRNPIDDKHLWKLVEKDAPEQVCDDFEREWKIEVERCKKKKEQFGDVKGTTPSIPRALWRCRWVHRPLIFGGCMKFLYGICSFFGPAIFMRNIIEFVGENGGENWEGWMYVVGLAVFAVVASVANGLCFYNSMLVGLRIRSAISLALYRKLIHVSSLSAAGGSTGNILNMMTTDCHRLFEASYFFHFVWASPFECMLAVAFLLREVGVSAIPGVVLLLLFIPLQGKFGRHLQYNRQRSAPITDTRVGLMSEILQGIRLIKLYAWEEPFAKKVAGVREREMHYMRRTTLFRSLNLSLVFISPLLVTIVTFATYISLSSSPFTASKAFTVIALFNLIRYPLALIPVALKAISESLVAVKRIGRFIAATEKPERPRLEDGNLNNPWSVVIRGSFSWEKEGEKDGQKKEGEKGEEKENVPRTAEVEGTPIERERDDPFPSTDFHFSLEIPKGSLCIIFGPVGGGKSSLLSAILGQLSPKPSKYSKNYSNTLPADSADSKKYLNNTETDSEYSNNYSNSIEGDENVLENDSSGDNAEREREGHREREGERGGEREGEIDSEGESGVWVEGGEIAYVPQQAWIFNATARENILYGGEMERERYDEVVNACALEEDFAQWEHGDETEIGERGINLSGGQRHRLSLARALYHRSSSLLLLDDPLSPIDTGVAGRVVRGAILGPLGRTRGNADGSKQQRTVVVVTQDPGRVWREAEKEREREREREEGSERDESNDQHSPETDTTERKVMFVLVDKRKIIASGTMEEILAQGVDINKYMGHGHAENGGESDDEEKEGEREREEERERELEEVHVSLPASVEREIERERELESEIENVLGGLDENPDALVADVGIHKREIVDPSVCDDEDEEEERERERELEEEMAETERESGERDTKEKAGKLIEAEDRNLGNVSKHIYLSYFLSSGTILFISAVFLAFLTSQALRVAGDWYLSHWLGDEEREREIANRTETAYYSASDSDGFSMDEEWEHYGIYTGFLAGACIFQFLRSWMFVRMSVSAAVNLHNGSWRRVLRAPMAFFETTPVGRILNRFGRDQDAIDSDLPDFLEQSIQYWLFVLGTLVVVIIASRGGDGVPWLAVVIIPVVICVVGALQSIYRTASRDLKRIDSVTRSPMYSHVTASVSGLAVIQAFESGSRFCAEMARRVRSNADAFFAFNVASRWLGTRLDLVIAMLSTVMAAFSVALRDELSAAIVGLGLSYTLQLAGLFQWTVRVTAEAENAMTSVERQLHYATHIPQEPFERGINSQRLAEVLQENGGKIPESIDIDTHENTTSKPTHNLRGITSTTDDAIISKPTSGADAIISTVPQWPSEGRIVIKDAWMRYRVGLPAVLRGVDVEIRGGERVGIVGRTGAGKSSLTVALFRLCPLLRGQISIDSLDISSLSLSLLRSSLSIIPQDPILFSGTIRSNLDPFYYSTDQQVWDALERVHLKERVREMEGGIESVVEENGENFSVGERQLMCFARAILRRPKILVMDEATASVDPTTDALIHQTIQEEFSTCTLLIIAHRLHTIIGCDRVLIMDFGRVAEYAAPHELLQQKDSMFRKLVEELGEKGEREMERLAEEAYRAKGKE